jgi:hypothetical protein
MKSNLTTGQVDFSLYLDFRPMKSRRKPLLLTKDAQTVEIPINLVNGTTQADITTTDLGVTISPSTITQSQFIDVSVPENLNTPSNILAENSDFLITEEYQNLVTENSSIQVTTLDVQYTFRNGDTVDETIQILQQ